MFTVADPGIDVDLGAWPVVIKRVGSKVGREEMAAYLDKLAEAFARGEPFGAVVIVKQRGTLDWEVLKQYGAFAKRHEETMRKHYRAVAFVFPGDVFRMLLSAILAVTPTPVPYKVFGDQQAAYDWVCGELRSAGAKVPAQRPVLWP